MGGCSDSSVENDREEFASENLTLVLVGKTGNGKSATGNSILGTTGFESKRSSSGVTATSERKSKTFEDGRVLNVIDTPGMFDSSADPEFIRKEIVSCIDKARDGVHAVLVVFSICNRFSEEENAVISSLVTLFGTKIYDHMIIVFTGGDDLEYDGKSLEDFLLHSPEQLKKILCCCENRCVVFDNRTQDEAKKSRQVQQLLSYVNMVLEKNDGKPYRNEIFEELKKDNVELLKQTERFRALQDTKVYTAQEVLLLIEKMRDENLKRIIKAMEAKFMEIQENLQKQLKKERAARIKAEKKAKKAKEKYEQEKKTWEEEEKGSNGDQYQKSWYQQCSIL